ncbi:MAG: class II aldolase/adducin family protein [Elusimicrobiota bacterium]|nr:class II aldolase/adducin family protein [Elusimicrobiota bacterium]
MKSSFSEFKETGQMLWSGGLISAAAGNLSVKEGSYSCPGYAIRITASGSLLGFLKREDIVKVNLDTGLTVPGQVPGSARPSVEINIHKSIYENSSYSAVAHAHPPTAIALSYDSKEIELIDDEGKFYLPRVPVLKVSGSGISSREVARELPGIIRDTGLVVVEGHGVFAAAENLKKCGALISTLEHSALILYRKKTFER